MTFLWHPSDSEISKTNLYQFWRQLGLSDYAALHQWSTSHRDEFWQRAADTIGIRFTQPPSATLKSSGTKTEWFPGARMNIAESCFQAPSDRTAIFFQSEAGAVTTWSYGKLRTESQRVAAALQKLGVSPGQAIAIDMVLNPEAVAIYLGIVLCGAVVVSIADSFAPEEIATRLRIADAKYIFTQDHITRGGKTLPLFAKVKTAQAPPAIVLPSESQSLATEALRQGDLTWERFLAMATEPARIIYAEPDAATNILFSSGTTGDPKAIPWTHTTPIKCAVDGYFHHDIHPTDVLAWPTNLGWMMGPWLLYAGLINRCTIALYGGAPTGSDFGDFVNRAGVTILGLVPSIVKAWRASRCMEGKDWSKLRLFSSTGECSNAEDYAYLMGLAANRPVIEYCGGTEIGGGYLTGTLVQPAAPATFSTPALGIEILLLDENGQPGNSGELFLVPPSIGLSSRLLNKDHHDVYFSGAPSLPGYPPLRRHGDEVERLTNGYYRALGRADDTMNLGGIKVSSAEIERVVATLPWVADNAAIAVNPPGGGPSLLALCLVLRETAPPGPEEQKSAINRVIKEKLNPLFRADRIATFTQLPRTASNKVMRRVLRDELAKKSP